jgi:hypothetical protein
VAGTPAVSAGVRRGTPEATPEASPAESAPESEKQRNREVRPSGAQQLVAYYVDLLTEIGSPAPARLKGQVARQVGELLGEGIPGEVVGAALRLLVEKRLNPSSLPSLIPEAAAGPGRRGREHIADRMLRKLTGGTDGASS